MLPQGSVGGNTILTEVDENVPANVSIHAIYNIQARSSCLHRVTVHGLAHENIVVVVVAKDLLDGIGSAVLESINGLLGSAPLLQLVQDLFDVD